MRKVDIPDDVIVDIREYNVPKHRMLNATHFINNGRTPLIPYDYCGGKIAKFLLEDEHNFEIYCRYILEVYEYKEA